MRCIFCNISRLHRASRRVFLSVPWGRTKKRSGNTPQRSRKLRKSGSGHARGPDGSASEYSGPTPGGGVRNVRREGVWHVRRLSWRGRSGGADCSFGSFADGPDADRAASGCGYLISRSGCSRRKCSQLCDPLREAAFLPPPSPLTRSGPRTAWSGLEVV